MMDLTPIFQAIISLVSLLITSFLIPWIKAKISIERLNEISKWAKIAVSAAEMIYTESGAGEIKKSYVMNYLAAKGYYLKVDEIEALIEAAVHDMNKGIEND